MIRAIKYAGFDLTDPNDERMLARMFVGGYERIQRHDLWVKRRAGVVVWILASFFGTVLSLVGPVIFKWVQGFSR